MPYPSAPHLRNFIETVQRKGTQDDLHCGPRDALAGLVVCDKIKESLATRSRVEIDPAEFDA